MVPFSIIRPFCLGCACAIALGSSPLQAASNDDASASNPTPQFTGESLAERELRNIQEREQEIWSRLEGRADDEHSKLRAEAEFRTIISSYQNLLSGNPKFAEGFAAYGLLLRRVGARDDAIHALLKANEIDPNIAMVKNEIGNHLAEDAEYQAALPYYLAAIELAPDVALYHYQLGTLLHEFRRFLIDDGIYDRPTLDREMQSAFKRAAELAPETWAYAYRYAESFYDLESPNWSAALQVWGKLNARAKPGVERQTIQLHMARVLAEMGRTDGARALLAGIDEPVLASGKRQVEELLAPAPTADGE